MAESVLRAGDLVGVAVGGAEEALFDWDYQPHWNRKGFAKLAVNTGKLENISNIRYSDIHIL